MAAASVATGLPLWEAPAEIGDAILAILEEQARARRSDDRTARLRRQLGGGR